MRISLFAGALLALVLLFGALPARAQEPTPVGAPAGGGIVNQAAFAATTDPALPAWVPGELLVGVEDASALAAAVQHAGLQDAVGVAAVMSAAAADGSAPTRATQVVQVPIGQELAIAQLLATQPGIRYVEPNAYAYAAQDGAAAADGEDAVEAALVPPGFVVDDTFYATRQWNMQRVNAARAWQLALTAGIFAAPSNQIIVAVVDSGVDRAHPEFAGRLLVGKNYVECTFDDLNYPVLDRNGYQLCNEPVIDDFGHGTHVAGIVAAATNDKQGVAGIAPMIQIDPRRVLNGLGNGSIDNVALAIREAADAGAQIINLSLVVKLHYVTLEEAVEYAASKGVLLVAAAGNDNVNLVYWPAAYPEVVAVAALDYSNQPASYSNRGPENDIAAPGGTLQTPVFSAWPHPSSFPIGPNGQPQTRCSSGLVQDGTGHYCTNYGTSFAAPAVAGAAALLLALDPTLTPIAARQLLQESAAPLPYTVEQVGAGRLDVANALRALAPPTLQLAAPGMFTEVLSTDEPFSYTVRLDNPSTQPISWTASLELNTRPKAAENNQPFGVDRIWITMTESLSNTQQGTTAFGDPDVLAFTINPRGLLSGTYSSRLHLRISTPRPNTTPLLTQESADITIQVNQRSERLWMPILLHQTATSGQSPVPYVGYRWELPAQPADRVMHDFTIAPPISQTYGITTVESLTLTLPSAVRVQNQSFAKMRIHADGFVSFPDNRAPFGFTPGINECLASPRWQAAVYGWWADLDANAPGAQVSSFSLADGRYVIEYSNVPTSEFAFPVVEPYSVSFQIVLHADGSVGLNYADVPPFDGEEPYATVGVEAVDGLFYSQVACSTPSAAFGELPQAGESFLIRARDIF